MLSIAWGRHFFLNEIWYNVMPLFNKFRSLSMALALVQGLAAMLAALGLQAYFSKEVTDKRRKKGLFIAGGTTLGILFLTLLMSGMFDYSGPKDARLGDQLATLLEADRLSLLRKDVGRSILFTLLAIGGLYMYLGRKISALVSVLILTLLVTVDMWSVGSRIINPSKFQTKKKSSVIAESAADKQIKQDKELHFKILDLSKGDPFTNAMGAYHHKMIGGYHPAKLMRYNDVIEKYLREPGKYMNVLGMLNTKYIIQNQGNASVAIPLREKALGNAWFVKSYRKVKNADLELDAIGSIDPKEEAVFDQAYASALDGFNIDFDSTATIKLTNYHPDNMEYTYSAKKPQLVVFSEVYYPESKGWSLSVGDQKVPILKANYLLRAAILPAGQNQKLNMKFYPKSFYTGEKISWAASIVLLLSLFAGFFFSFKNGSSGTPIYNLPENENVSATTQYKAPIEPKQKGKKGRKK